MNMLCWCLIKQLNILCNNNQIRFSSAFFFSCASSHFFFFLFSIDLGTFKVGTRRYCRIQALYGLYRRYRACTHQTKTTGRWYYEGVHLWLWMLLETNLILGWAWIEHWKKKLKTNLRSHTDGQWIERRVMKTSEWEVNEQQKVQQRQVKGRRLRTRTVRVVQQLVQKIKKSGSKSDLLILIAMIIITIILMGNNNRH